jgi:hypothetical protein
MREYPDPLYAEELLKTPPAPRVEFERAIVRPDTPGAKVVTWIESRRKASEHGEITLAEFAHDALTTIGFAKPNWKKGHMQAEYAYGVNLEGEEKEVTPQPSDTRTRTSEYQTTTGRLIHGDQTQE